MPGVAVERVEERRRIIAGHREHWPSPACLQPGDEILRDGVVGGGHLS